MEASFCCLAGSDGLIRQLVLFQLSSLCGGESPGVETQAPRFPA